MASVTSNFNTISVQINKLAGAIDLNRPGRQATLGKDLFGIIATGIVNRSIEKQSGPDGSKWSPNKEPYARSVRKAGKPIGVLSGAMLSLENVAGVQTINAHNATMVYGTSAAIQERLGYFESGRSGIQDPRPVYGIDAEIEAAVMREIETHVAGFIQDLK